MTTTKLEQSALAVPNGYALVSIDAIKAWGKYDEVHNACQFPVDQAEREPVAWVTAKESFCGFPKLVFSETQKNGYKPLYAAPVRTKDLTDAEITSKRRKTLTDVSFARAVIAADREKNK